MKNIYKVKSEKEGTINFRVLASGHIRISSDYPLVFSSIKATKDYRGEIHHWSKKKKYMPEIPATENLSALIDSVLPMAEKTNSLLKQSTITDEDGTITHVDVGTSERNNNSGLSDIEKEIEKASAETPSNFASGTNITSKITTDIEQDNNVVAGDKIEIDLMGTVRQAKIIETYDDENKMKVRLLPGGEELVAPGDWFIKKI